MSKKEKGENNKIEDLKQTERGKIKKMKRERERT